jgi:hypothetical protein
VPPHISGGFQQERITMTQTLRVLRPAWTLTKTLRIAAFASVLATAVIAGTPSHAAPQEYHFAFEENGANVGSGSLTIDGAALNGVGAEFFWPLHGLLGFDLTIHGVPFTMTEDLAFPNFPSAIFDDGLFISFAYTGGHIGPVVYELITGGGNVYTFIPGDTGIAQEGTIVPMQLAAVPEPSVLLASLAGLVAIGGLRRRRAAAGR